MQNLPLVVSSYLAELLTFWVLWSQVQQKDEDKFVF